MPQELRVLQCMRFEMFQVDIVKKSNKWQCKMCDAKQNVRKVLFHGTGADCRKKVQQFNQEKANRIEQKSDAILNLLETEDDDVENDLLLAASQVDENIETTANEKTKLQKRKLTTAEQQQQHGGSKNQKTSKWDIFL